MSGFVGFIGRKKVDEKKNLAQKMNDLIAHRGPDAEGYYIDESIAIGHRALYAADKNPEFPYVDGNLVVALDGRICNREELNSELRDQGADFKTDSDEECIAKGFALEGLDFFKKIRGLFSVAIWDKDEEELTLLKDIYGSKPLFYYSNEDFLFGSEIKAFLAHPDFVKEVNRDRLPEYLTFEYIPDEETMFKNVYMLLNGECLIYKNGKIEKKIYDEIKYNIDQDKPMSYWVDEISKAMKEAVEINNKANSQVGNFLSSGVDSSFVVKEKSKLGPVKAFSVGYNDDKISELSYAREFAEKIGVDFNAKVINGDDTFENIGKIQYLLDEPLCNPSLLPLYFLSQYARKDVKFVMSGEGADEMFGGYNYYKEPVEYQGYRKLPKFLRSFNAKVAKALPKIKGRRFLIRANKDIEERFFRHEYVFSKEERKKVLKGNYDYKDPSYFTKDIFARVKNLDDVTKMQYVDMHTWMLYDINLKADRMSMANSLEVRMPILDRKLLDIATRIPTKYKVSKKQTKIAFRNAALREIPEKTAEKKKLGFPVPLNAWLRDDRYYPIIKEKFNSDFAKEFFNVDYINEILEIHRSGKDGYMKRIWIVFCFLVWYEEYFIKR